MGVTVLGIQHRVALRKESVDRNRNSIKRCLMSVVVALRKESVDRNWYCLGTRVSETLSLSARRAWIEIMLCLLFRPVVGVALRKESVDRNAW